MNENQSGSNPPTMELKDRMIVHRSTQIALPSPESYREMTIRQDDLIRLKRNLKQLAGFKKNFTALYGVMFGIGGSATFSLGSLWNVTNLPTWVFPTHVVVAIAAILFGLFVVYVQATMKTQYKISVENIILDIEDIEKRFTQNEEDSPSMQTDS